MSTGNQTDEYTFSGYTLNVSVRKLVCPDGSIANLSSRALDTLLLLVQHSGNTLSKQHLMDVVWPNSVVEENNLNQAISSVRKALGDSKTASRFIQTIPGRGYCFVGKLDATLSAPNQAEAPGTTNPEPAPTEPLFHLIPNSSPDHPWTFGTRLALAGFTLFAALLLYGVFRDTPAPTTIQPPVISTDERPGEYQAVAKSIAILPFTNLNPDSGDELLALGLHNELINQLSKVKSLKVIARDSVINLAGKHYSISDIASALKVESLMTGTILIVGNQTHVSLQMVNPRTGITLWADSYDVNVSNLRDLISIQSDIALHVASALETEINQQEQSEIAALPTQSFEAYRFNLAAENTYYSQDFAQTWRLTQQALELDPDFQDALYNFAYVNNVLTGVPLPGLTANDHFQLALGAAEHLIELAPDKSAGYALRASALATHKEWEQVDKEVEHLHTMKVPASEMKFHGPVLMSLGYFDEAVALYEASLIKEPVDFYSRGFLLAAYELNGQRDKARQEYALGEELNPSWWGDTVNIFLSLGRNEPLDGIEEAINIPAELKILLKHPDDREIIMNGIIQFQRKETKVSAEGVYYSALAAYIGEPELAISLMRESVQEVWLSFYWLWLPIFDDARQLDSFKQLLMDADIVAFWKAHGWPKACQPEGDTFTCNWKAYH